jgi:hypothetical protein
VKFEGDKLIKVHNIQNFVVTVYTENVISLNLSEICMKGVQYLHVMF